MEWRPQQVGGDSRNNAPSRPWLENQSRSLGLASSAGRRDQAPNGTGDDLAITVDGFAAQERSRDAATQRTAHVGAVLVVVEEVG